MAVCSPTAVVAPLPLTGSNAGPTDVAGTIQQEVPFACAFDRNGALQGWAFNVIEDQLSEDDTATVVERSIGFRDLTGVWTDDWVIPADWTLDTCESMPSELNIAPRLQLDCLCDVQANGDVVKFVRAFRQQFNSVSTPAASPVSSVQLGDFTDETLATAYTPTGTVSECADISTPLNLTAAGPIVIEPGGSLMLPLTVTSYSVRRASDSPFVVGGSPGSVTHTDGGVFVIPDAVSYDWESENDCKPFSGTQQANIEANDDRLIVTYTYLAT